MSPMESPDITVITKLATIETKLDRFVAGHDDHENRLRLLERKIWAATGIAAVASPLLLAALKGIIQ